MTDAVDVKISAIERDAFFRLFRQIIQLAFANFIIASSVRKVG